MMQRWLLAYDIADKRRLNRVHRQVARHARMLQYSLYLFVGTRAQLDPWLASLLALIDPERDDLRLYPLARQVFWRQYGNSLATLPGALLFPRLGAPEQQPAFALTPPPSPGRPRRAGGRGSTIHQHVEAPREAGCRMRKSTVNV